jgi:hypothetical protein
MTAHDFAREDFKRDGGQVRRRRSLRPFKGGDQVAAFAFQLSASEVVRETGELAGLFDCIA